jgi:hypothetical protein
MKKETKLPAGHRCLASVVACFVIACLPGCGDEADRWTEQRPEVHPVSGVVMFNGERLAEAQVFFRPMGGGKPAYGVTDQKGRFELQTFEPEDGAVEGTHQVSVRKVELLEPEQPVNPEGELPPLREKSLIPRRYSDFETSGLQAQVTEGGENSFTFELEGSPP